MPKSTRKAAQGRKRKADEEDEASALFSKKAKVIEKSTSFSQLPLDVLYHIFVQGLRPIDLLHISRVNKNMRIVFLDPSSLFIWKQVMRKLPTDFPRCPKGMHPLRFMNFIDEKDHCHFCSSTERVWKAFEYQFHVCQACLLCFLR
jgi:hypothetical protein